MANETNRGGARLRLLRVQNFRALDSLNIEFPPPRMAADPDVLVLGSRNGVGKTSVLEAVALLLLGANHSYESLAKMPYLAQVCERLVRAGAKQLGIQGKLDFGDTLHALNFSWERGQTPQGGASYGGDLHRFFAHSPRKAPSALKEFAFLVMGLNSDPIISNRVMYFHSYRKVQEGPLALNHLMSNEAVPNAEGAGGLFKRTIWHLAMGEAGWLEGVEEDGSTLEKLNEIVRRYASGTIGKFRPAPDGTVDFTILPDDGRDPFPFDGLSSGQKEIISTLFLIWYHSQDTPAVVLIDEPELHLNAEWHCDFVYQAHSLAPQNQYIIATHSEDIFESVSKERRILLSVGKDA